MPLLYFTKKTKKKKNQQTHSHTHTHKYMFIKMETIGNKEYTNEMKTAD